MLLVERLQRERVLSDGEGLRNRNSVTLKHWTLGAIEF